MLCVCVCVCLCLSVCLFVCLCLLAVVVVLFLEFGQMFAEVVGHIVGKGFEQICGQVFG